MLARPSLWLAVLSCLTACGDDAAGPGGSTTGATGSTSGDTSESSSSEPDPTTGATSSSSTTAGPTTSSESSGSSEASDDGTSTTGEPGEVLYPEPDWQPGLPEDHGLDSAGLAAMAKIAEDMDSNCLVVTRGGVLVGEWYWNDFTADKDQDNVYSITKSITSALVGIADDHGELDVEAPAGFAEWVGTDSEAVTIRNLISNDSGRKWDFNGDYLQLSLAPDQTDFAIDRGHAKPIGSWWEYNNAAIQTLERALSLATDTSVATYAQSQLFDKIHMSAKLGADAEGHPLTYQGVSASCRDLARFGYLYLRGGQWAGGEQVVPAAWVAESITPSTTLNSAYGFMWWLNRPGHWVLPSVPLRDEGDGKLLPKAPDELFAAVGAFGQLIVVDPTTDSVWVRLGPVDLGDSSGFGKLDNLWDAFAASLVP